MERRLRILSCCSEANPMGTMVKVAFATSDMKHVDQHFGAAEAFAIYSLDEQDANLVEVVQFGQLDMDGNEDKLSAKIEALDGCIAVYCQAIGASAVNQLRPKGIQPVKVTPCTPVSQAIAALQTEMRDGPSVWLARAIEKRNPDRASRFEAMEAEGWSE
ncbi:NifB/NifX family molybdenum-iron cluster-binding protein [Imhoffiella purpurea]|uniref:Nitrogenase FeMo-cofactor carrier protein NifX n=1 Tax=Imhoffiella purpurea TaxID=1249627 RepID=W9VFM1_9GAMM|nr:NifB/NifX family molybdenum-iron cluster-binding protein [Imhoffiella purpurea]EXJ14812.1 Nitrogenase FeMo-cofactor carrier protein NifX [Imhoffiella purpurea]